MTASRPPAVAAGGPVGIIGLGLIGGSIGLDVLATGRGVRGWDPDPDTRRAASAAGIEVADDVEALVAGAALVVVAAPPPVVADLVAHVVDVADVPVTDVASVRDPVALGMAMPLPPAWVGSHPMAGTERSSFAAARRGLLVGAPWLVTPHDASGMDALVAVVDLALALQARPLVVAPDVHDEVVATVSHLPHLLAWALQQRGRAVGGDVVTALAGPSFRDGTRVAASSPAFWADLLQRNHRAVAAAVADLQVWLDDTVSMAGAGEGELEARLEAARRRPGPRPRPDAPDEVVVLDHPATALATLREAGRHGRHVTGIATVSDAVHLLVAPAPT